MKTVAKFLVLSFYCHPYYLVLTTVRITTVNMNMYCRKKITLGAGQKIWILLDHWSVPFFLNTFEVPYLPFVTIIIIS